MKNTYFDQNRLVEETDRRFHAADIERAGGFIQVVPAVVERLAPEVVPGAWSLSRRRLEESEDIARLTHDENAVRRVRSQLWWVQQWRRQNDLYRVRNLSPTEKDLAARLLGHDGMPPECFPRAEGRLEDDNDARIIAQVIAVGGTLLLSSNLVMVEDEDLQEWFDRHHNEWPGVRAHVLVQRVDPLYRRWWKADGGPGRLTRAALGAFWPKDPHAPARLVLEHATEGLEAMARGHFETFAPLALAHLEQTPDIEAEIETVRRTLPHRMRRAEVERRAVLESGAGTKHDTTQRMAHEDNGERYHD